MATRTVRLTQDQDAFLDTVVRDGRYASADEAVADAVETLRDRIDEVPWTEETLRAAIQEGLDDLDNGNYDEVALEDLEEYFEKTFRSGR